MFPYKADNWAWANRWIGDGITPPHSTTGMPLFPSWVPEEDQRRLATYTFCAAVGDVCGHYWHPRLDEDQRRQWREYGDPELFTNQARSMVLGDTQTITMSEVDGDPVDDDDDDPPNATATAALEWLQAWAIDEKLTLRLLTAEHDALGLGDAVYALSVTDDDTDGPCLRVHDPGFYFPDPASQGPDDDFPRVVHLAWEEPTPGDRRVMQLRRRTWRLVDLDGPRALPWDPKSKQTVIYSDGVWPLDGKQARNGFYDLSDGAATWAEMPDGTPAVNVDLGIDFIPVVHIPNGTVGGFTWGRPVWWAILRLLDDIAASDTDAQLGSELFGSGALLEKGSNIGNQAGPGAKYSATAEGDARFLDMSAGMKAMVEYVRALLKRASENSRLPEEALGRTDAQVELAGVAIQMRWGPASNLVRELRAVRDDKHSLILKFALRLGQKLGQVPAGDLPTPLLTLGSFLPSDKTEAVDAVARLWGGVGIAPSISLETAVRILTEAGFPIEDAVEEVKRINQQAFTRAVGLLDATGDEQLVRLLLRNGGITSSDIKDAPAVSPVAAPPSPTGGPPVPGGSGGLPVPEVHPPGPPATPPSGGNGG